MYNIYKLKTGLRQAVLGVLLSMLAVAPVWAQSTSVSGVVTAANDGLALPGVSISIEGTATGTITDLDGRYTIVANKGQRLVFSFIGYAQQLHTVGDASTLNIVMELDTKLMEEVVVVGYGEVRKSDVTGSVSQVKMDKLQTIPAQSVEKLLQGRTAGIQVINSSQDPGAGATIRVRGGSSMRGSNAPLVVVDGFPLGDAGDLKQVNPADIESVEVLKDASASAIYGSRGANGVIMITTKKAKSGSSVVEIQQQTTLSQFGSKLNIWHDPLLMAQLANEEMINANQQIIYNGRRNSNGVYYPSLVEIASGVWPHHTRWDEIVFRPTPVSNNTTVSVRNANDKTSFNLSANYFEQNGVYIEDGYRKYVVNLGVQHHASERLFFSTSNIFSNSQRRNNGGLAFWRNPLWPVYDEAGRYFRTTINDFEHPLAQTNHVQNQNDGHDFISSLLGSLKITDALTLRSQLNYKYGASVADRYMPKDYTEAGFFNNGAAYVNRWNGQDLLSETYLTYDNTFAQAHKLNVMVGHSYQHSLSRTEDLESFDFVNEALGNENMGAGNPQRNVHRNGLWETKLLSFTGRVNYALLDKYLFTATFRADGSSKFGANNKWAMFPSAALSWKAHNEEFVQNLGLFDELKLRLSYGVSGNQGISPYQTLSRYGTETYFDNGAWRTSIGPGYVVGNEGADGRYKVWGGIPNNDLKWETTAQYNLGLDLAFFDKRLKATFDVYQKNTSDLLRERLLSLSSGYNRIWVNDGEVSNRGVELTLEGDLVRTPDFRISSTLILSRNRSEVVSLGDAVASGLETDAKTGMQYEFSGYNFTQFRQAANVLAIGQPLNVFYGYRTSGIIQTLDEGLKAGLSGDLARPGEFKYLDLNGDKVIDTKDRTIIGDPNPDFMASLALDFAYKGFDLSIFLNGVFGNDVLFQNRIGQPDVAPLRWTMDNATNEFPSLRAGRQYFLSDWFVKDGSFVRVQNLNFGYNFNTAKIRPISKLRVYVNAANLHTFTKFEGYDPEVGLDGIYWGGYPRLRNWTFGVNVTF